MFRAPAVEQEQCCGRVPCETLVAMLFNQQRCICSYGLGKSPDNGSARKGTRSKQQEGDVFASEDVADFSQSVGIPWQGNSEAVSASFQALLECRRGVAHRFANISEHANPAAKGEQEITEGRHFFETEGEDTFCRDQNSLPRPVKSVPKICHVPVATCLDVLSIHPRSLHGPRRLSGCLEDRLHRHGMVGGRQPRIGESSVVIPLETPLN